MLGMKLVVLSPFSRTEVYHIVSANSMKTSLLVPLVLASAYGKQLETPPRVGDIGMISFEAFTTAGSVGFIWTGSAQLLKRVPLPVAGRAALTTARRWGGMSAGFQGGKLAGQAVGLPSDRWCNLCAGAVAGLFAATSASNIPMSIATFVAISAVLDGIVPSMAEQARVGGRSKEQLQRGNPRAEALTRAREEYARRHKDDPVRLRALQ